MISIKSCLAIAMVAGVIGCGGSGSKLSDIMPSAGHLGGGSPAVAIEGKRVAVLVQPEKSLPMRQIEDGITGGLIDRGYALVSRSDLERVLDEIKLQQSPYSSDRSAARIGELLNVSTVVVVEVTNVGSNATEVDLGQSPTLPHVNEAKEKIQSISIGARAITVETAKVQWSKVGKASRSAVMSQYVELVRGVVEGDIVDRAVADLLGQIAPQQSSGST